ncbi:hypothetical protein IGI37_002899 [Enterococcus sp. AZ194]
MKLKKAKRKNELNWIQFYGEASNGTVCGFMCGLGW